MLKKKQIIQLIITATNVEAEKTETKLKKIFLRTFFNWLSNTLNVIKMPLYDTDKQMRPSARILIFLYCS